jgi:hypothetical protein
MARFHGQEVLLVGTQGPRHKAKVYRNFGLPNPGRVSKALRACTSRKFSRPILFVDVTRKPRSWPKSAARRKRCRELARNGTAAGSYHHHHYWRGWQRRQLAIAVPIVLMMESAVLHHLAEGRLDHGATLAKN